MEPLHVKGHCRCPACLYTAARCDHPSRLPQFTIYARPSDHPGHYVMRLFMNDQPTRTAWLFDTLADARAAVPAGLHMIPRDPNDDPVIVEVWL